MDWATPVRALLITASTFGIRPKALRRNCSLRSVSRGSSMGSHW